MPGLRKDTTALLSSLRGLFSKPELIGECALNAYLIPSEDAHQSEYISASDKRREFISGFTGSRGLAVVTEQQAALWTDGRYFLQAEKELDQNWTLMKEGRTDTPKPSDWLKKVLPKNGVVGVDPWLISADEFKSWRKSLRAVNLSLRLFSENLVDRIWQDKPAATRNPIMILDEKFAGKSWQEKVREVRAKMAAKDASLLIVSKLDEVAWLFNLRGSDTPYNPVFFAFAAIGKDFVKSSSSSQVNVKWYLTMQRTNSERTAVGDTAQDSIPKTKGGEGNQMGQRHLLPNPLIQDPVAASNPAQSAPPVASQFQSAQQQRIELSSGDGRPASALSSSSDENVPGSPQISHHPEHQAILHFTGIQGSHQIPAAPNPQQAAPTSPGFDVSQLITPAVATAPTVHPIAPDQDKINISASSFPSPQKVVTVTAVPQQVTAAAGSSSSFSGTSSSDPVGVVQQPQTAVPTQAAVVVQQPAPIPQPVPQPTPVQPQQQPAVYVQPSPVQPAPQYQQPQQAPQQYQQPAPLYQQPQPPDLVSGCAYTGGAMVPYGQRGPPPPQDQQVAMYRQPAPQPTYYQQHQQPQFYADPNPYYQQHQQYQGGYGPMMQYGHGAFAPVGYHGGYGPAGYPGMHLQASQQLAQLETTSPYPDVPPMQQTSGPQEQELETKRVLETPAGRSETTFKYSNKPSAAVLQSGQAHGASFSSNVIGQVPQPPILSAPQLLAAPLMLSAASSQFQQQQASVQPQTAPTVQSQPQPTPASKQIVVEGIPFDCPVEAAKFKHTLDQSRAAAAASSASTSNQPSASTSLFASRFNPLSLQSPASGADDYAGLVFGNQDDDDRMGFDGDNSSTSAGRGRFGGRRRLKDEKETVLVMVKEEPDDRRDSFFAASNVSDSDARAYADEFAAQEDDKTMAKIRFTGDYTDGDYSDDEKYYTAQSKEKNCEKVPPGMVLIPTESAMVPRHKRLQSIYDRYMGYTHPELLELKRMIHAAVVKKIQQMQRLDLPRVDFPILTEAEVRQFDVLLSDPNLYDLSVDLPANLTKPPMLDNLAEMNKLMQVPLKNFAVIRKTGAFVFRFRGKLTRNNLKAYGHAGEIVLQQMPLPTFYTLTAPDKIDGCLKRTDVTAKYGPLFEGKLTELRDLLFAMSNGPFPPKLQADFQATLKKFYASDDQRPPLIFVDGQMGDEMKKRYPHLQTFVKEFWQYATAHPEIVFVEYADAPSLINKDTSVCYFNQANERGLLTYAFGDDESICQAKSRITVGFGSTTPWTVEPGKFVRHEMTLSGRTVYFTIKREDVPRALDYCREEFFVVDFKKCARADQHDEFIVDPQLFVDRNIDVGTVIAMPGDVISFEEGTMWCSVAAGLLENVVVYWMALTFHHYALKLGRPDPLICSCGKAKKQRLFVETNIERVKLAWYLACRDQKIAFNDDPESICYPCNFFPDRQATKKQRKEAMANHVRKDATRDICMSDPIGYFEGDLRQALKNASVVRMGKAAEKAVARKSGSTTGTPKTIGGLGRFSRKPSNHSEGDAGSMVSEQLTPAGTSGRSSAAVTEQPASDHSDAEEGQGEMAEKEEEEQEPAKAGKKKAPAKKGSVTAAKEPVAIVDMTKDSSDSDNDKPTKKPSAAAKQSTAKPTAVDTATSSSKSSAPKEDTVESMFAKHHAEQDKKAKKTAAATAAVLAPPPRAAANAAAAAFSSKATQPAPSVPLKRGEFPKVKIEPKIKRVKGGSAKGRAQKASAAKKQKGGDDSGEDSEQDEEIEDDNDFEGFTQDDIDESEGGGHDLRHRKRDDSDDDGKGGGAAGVSGSAAKRQRKQRSELERLSNY